MLRELFCHVLFEIPEYKVEFIIKRSCRNKSLQIKTVVVNFFNLTAAIQTFLKIYSVVCSGSVLKSYPPKRAVCDWDACYGVITFFCRFASSSADVKIIIIVFIEATPSNKRVRIIMTLTN